MRKLPVARPTDTPVTSAVGKAPSARQSPSSPARSSSLPLHPGRHFKTSFPGEVLIRITKIGDLIPSGIFILFLSCLCTTTAFQLLLSVAKYFKSVRAPRPYLRCGCSCPQSCCQNEGVQRGHGGPEKNQGLAFISRKKKKFYFI